MSSTLEPITRIEQFLSDIIDQGGGGGGGSGGGGVLVVHANEQTGMLDKTWQEIFNALSSGTLAVVQQADAYEGYQSVSMFLIYQAEYDVENTHPYCVMTSNVQYYANNANDYPSVTLDDIGNEPLS